MTSVLGRMVRLFSGPRRIEDLFAEAVARLFELRPNLCVAWLEEEGLAPPGRLARSHQGRGPWPSGYRVGPERSVAGGGRLV